MLLIINYIYYKLYFCYELSYYLLFVIDYIFIICYKLYFCYELCY